MRVITDYLGRNEDGSWELGKTVEIAEEDRYLIIDYIKEFYPESFYEPDKYPLPPMMTMYLTDPQTDETFEFDINTKEWGLNAEGLNSTPDTE